MEELELFRLERFKVIVSTRLLICKIISDNIRITLIWWYRTLRRISSIAFFSLNSNSSLLRLSLVSATSCSCSATFCSLSSTSFLSSASFSSTVCSTWSSFFFLAFTFSSPMLISLSRSSIRHSLISRSLIPDIWLYKPNNHSPLLTWWRNKSLLFAVKRLWRAPLMLSSGAVNLVGVRTFILEIVLLN